MADVKRLAIVQSNYIPWRGYFDLIDSVDEFVLLDTAEYTTRDWRNRNQIKTPNGLLWLSIPVRTKGRRHQAIEDVEITERTWTETHLESIRHAYGRAPFFDQVHPVLVRLYAEAARLDRLTAVNRLFLEGLGAELAVTTPLTDASAHPGVPGADATARLVQICRDVGATHYISGPAAKAYMELDQFAAAGIEVEWFSYAGYTDYAQLHGSFEPAVSIVDTLMMLGAEARSVFRGGRG
jgi:hypothetical protein